MKLILAVDALIPPLSGIGCYTWELVSRLGQIPDIEHVRYFLAGQWIDDPVALSKGDPNVRKQRYKLPSWFKTWYWQQACRGEVFRGPIIFCLTMPKAAL